MQKMTNISQQLTIGTQQSDRITTITNTTWSEYAALNLPSQLVSFRNGVITIVSPGRNHEMIADYIRLIILTHCRQKNLVLFTYNQTTLKYEGKEGKEPDVAYCFGVDKDKPDLAVEVNLTSGGIDDLSKYQYLAIPEIWLWENSTIKIFILDESKYKLSKNSFCLKGLNCDRVTEIVNSCFGKSVLEVETYFR
jgi:Uma2 family endonuclease